MKKGKFKEKVISVGKFLSKGIPIHGAIKYHKTTKDNGIKYKLKMAGYVTWAVWSVGKLPFGYKYFVEPIIFPKENKLEQVVDESNLKIQKDTINYSEAMDNYLKD